VNLRQLRWLLVVAVTAQILWMLLLAAAAVVSSAGAERVTDRQQKYPNSERMIPMTQPTYPQPTQPAAPPQEPKKKRGVLKWIPLGILVVIILVAGVASCGGGQDTATPPATSGSSEPDPAESPAEEETYQVGEKAVDDDYQFTVTKIKCGVSRVGDTYSNEKAQGQFCLVSMRVKNIGNDAINFSSENQALIDTKGKNYSPDDEAWIYIDSDPFGEINPGNTLKTVVPFDVPRKVKPDYLLLKAGVWGASDGVKVTL
jgi:hypothetical protein